MEITINIILKKRTNFSPTKVSKKVIIIFSMKIVLYSVGFTQPALKFWQQISKSVGRGFANWTQNLSYFFPHLLREKKLNLICLKID